MSTDDLEAALASLRASVTESRAVSVEWPLLKPLNIYVMYREEEICQTHTFSTSMNIMAQCVTFIFLYEYTLPDIFILQ